jgi:hypothetical protein
MPGSTEHANPNTLVDDCPAEAMRLTQTLGKPIRVIRGSGAGWAGAPAVGLRYDGLYQITGEEMRHNAKGGLYVRFRLERPRTGQPALDTARAHPTSAEREDEVKVKDGYY